MSRRMTGIELVALLSVVVFVGAVFWLQKESTDVRLQDNSRKQDINTTYFYLEDVFFAAHRAYPETLDAAKLPGLEAATLKDPAGRTINAEDADYEYKPLNCHAGLCSGYSLTARLEKEANFSRVNRPH